MSVILDRLYNLHWVTPDVARSAQPYVGFYKAFLRVHGFKSLINLRGENSAYRWWRRERGAAKALGIRHFDVRLSSRNIPSRSVLASLFDAFDAMEVPTLIKCSGGQDRTGLAAALYLLRCRGPAGLGEAQAQLALWPYLHWPKSFQRWLKFFPVYAAEDADTVPLGAWVREHYDPKHFAAWLERRGAVKSYYAVQGDEIAT